MKSQFAGSRPSELISKVEERCIDIANPLNIQSARHCFLLITTVTNKKIKIELNSEGKLVVDYFYLDWTPSDSFRQCEKPMFSLHESIEKLDKMYEKKLVEKTMLKCKSEGDAFQEYEEIFNNIGYSCQEAALDGFNKICQRSENYLRNDYLKIMAMAAPKAAKFRFMGYEKFHRNIRAFDDNKYDELDPESVLFF